MIKFKNILFESNKKITVYHGTRFGDQIRKDGYIRRGSWVAINRYKNDNGYEIACLFHTRSNPFNNRSGISQIESNGYGNCG